MPSRRIVSFVLASLLVACGSAEPAAQTASPTLAASTTVSPTAIFIPDLTESRIAPPGTGTLLIPPSEYVERDGVGYSFMMAGEDTSSAGERLITLEVLIENVASARRVHYHPIALSISDSLGYVYKAEETASAQERTFVAVGEKIMPSATFRLPAAADGLLLTFTPQAATDDPLFALPLDNEKSALITPLEGPRIAAEGYAVTVVGVSRGAVRLRDGSEAENRLIIEVAIDNESGTKALNAMPEFFRLKRTMDTNYPAEQIVGPQALNAAHLHPGMRARGLIAFDVPADPAGYTLIYEPILGDSFSMKVSVQE